jgi:hypothetical protein
VWLITIAAAGARLSFLLTLGTHRLLTYLLLRKAASQYFLLDREPRL